MLFRSLIGGILESGTCICGNIVKPGSREERKLNELRRYVPKDEVVMFGSILLEDLSNIVDRGRRSAGMLMNGIERWGSNEKEIDRCRRELSEVSKALVDADDSHVSTIEAKLRMLKSSRDSLVGKLATLRHGRDELISRLAALNKEQEKIRVEDEKTRCKNDAYRTAAALETELYEVVRRYESESLGELRRSSSDWFRKLGDQVFVTAFSEISVGDDYSIEAIYRSGEEFLDNLSAGQRQVVALSFILALAQFASGSRWGGLPLVMDTPFARLSFQHRANILTVVPKACHQVIFLATRSEIASAEARLLFDLDVCKCAYEIDSNNSASSSLRLSSVSALMEGRV